MSSKEDNNPEPTFVTNTMDPRAAALDDDENNPESLVVTNSMDPQTTTQDDNIIEPKFTIPQLKKIFAKQQAIDVLKSFNPELFGIRTSRSKKITYLGEDLYTDIQKIDTKKLMNYTRDFSISNEAGKYKDINDDPEYYKRLIALTNVKKEDSPCHPQQFSESVVKPNMRRAIKDKSDDIVAAVIAMTSDKLKNHVKERINQQAKADYSEWLILKYNPNIMPTLKHAGGTDMYLITATAIVALDIKTTRSIWGITDPKEAITKLYENQGEDRFSSDPRLYIYLSDNDEIDEQQLRVQLETTYDIIFQYNNVTYNVIGARLIII
tara:strand:- start:3739 stop:4707 length:969 start_codon:yes stop_codon:yes gene_type:complete